MKRSLLLQSGRLLLAGAILLFLVKRFAGLLDEMDVDSLSFHPLWLIVSLGILIGYRTLLVYPWRTLYSSASQTEVSFQASWVLCQLSQLGKYLPGKVGQFIGIVALSRPLGLLKTESVISTLQALAIQCVLGFCIGVPVLLSPTANHSLHNWHPLFRRNAPILIGLTLVIVGLGCILLFFFFKGMFLKKMYPLQKSIRALFRVPRILRLLTVYFLLWVYFGIGFFFFVKSITPAVELGHFLMITGIYPFAWSIGFISLVTPGGLGVRESVLSVFLTLCLPPATTTLIALLSRVWVISAEILLASIAGSLYYRRKRENARRCLTC